VLEEQVDIGVLDRITPKGKLSGILKWGIPAFIAGLIVRVPPHLDAGKRKWEIQMLITFHLTLRSFSFTFLLKEAVLFLTVTISWAS